MTPLPRLHRRRRGSPSNGRTTCCAHGGKIAGILIEGEGVPLAAAIGFGVNCCAHPAGAEYPATDLAAGGADVEALVLFDRFGRRDGATPAINGDAATALHVIRSAWLDRAAGRGGALRVRLADREISWYFRDDRRGRPASRAVWRRGARSRCGRRSVSHPRDFGAHWRASAGGEDCRTRMMTTCKTIDPSLRAGEADAAIKIPRRGLWIASRSLPSGAPKARPGGSQ